MKSTSHNCHQKQQAIAKPCTKLQSFCHRVYEIILLYWFTTRLLSEERAELRPDSDDMARICRSASMLFFKYSNLIGYTKAVNFGQMASRTPPGGRRYFKKERTQLTGGFCRRSARFLGFLSLKNLLVLIHNYKQIKNSS